MQHQHIDAWQTAFHRESVEATNGLYINLHVCG